jgi:hypothetical protein
VLESGRSALFSQSSAHRAVHSSAITGSPVYDGQPHKSIYYSLAHNDDNPHLQELVRYLQVFQRALPDPQGGRIIFRDQSGEETSDIQQAVEVELAIREEITEHSDIHKRGRRMPQGSVALVYEDAETQITGQPALIQIASDEHPRAFDHPGSRQRIYDRIHGKGVQTVDPAGKPGDYVNLETMLTHEMLGIKEGLDDPYIRLQIQEYETLSDLFQELLEHDFKYIHAGMLRPHVQVQRHTIEGARAQLQPDVVRNGQYAQEMMRIAEIEDMDERMDEMERFSKRHQAMLADLLLSLDNQATLLDDAFKRITQIPILIDNYRELLRASQELNLIMGTVSPVEALGEVVRSWRAEFDDLTKYPNTTITIDFDTSNLDADQIDQEVIGSEAFLNATCKNLIMNAIAANSDARTMAITVTLEPVVISIGHGEDQQDFQYTEMVVRNTGRRIDLAQAEEMNTPGNKTYQRSYGTGEGRGFGLIRDGLHIASRLDVIGSTERGVMIYATPDDQPPGTEVRILMMNTSRRHRSRKLIV